MSIANNHIWDPLLYRTRCRTWPVPTGMTHRWRTTWLCVAPKRTSSWGQARVQNWRPACTQLTSYPGLYSRTACLSHYTTQPGSKLHFQLFTSNDLRLCFTNYRNCNENLYKIMLFPLKIALFVWEIALFYTNFNYKFSNLCTGTFEGHYPPKILNPRFSP